MDDWDALPLDRGPSAAIEPVSCAGRPGEHFRQSLRSYGRIDWEADTTVCGEPGPFGRPDTRLLGDWAAVCRACRAGSWSWDAVPESLRPSEGSDG